MLLLMQRAIERIGKNERLEAKLAAVEETSRTKTAFLSNMSHDIRTPLNTIIGYTPLASGDNDIGAFKTSSVIDEEVHDDTDGGNATGNDVAWGDE